MRYCYHADETYYDLDSDEYLLIRVTEHQPDYEVVATFKSLELAKEIAKNGNLVALRTNDDVMQIRLSAMRASLAARTDARRIEEHT